MSTAALQPTARLGRRYGFAASHRLHSDALDESTNREVFGKCNNPFGHGHNYVVEVLLLGPVDPATGMVTNLSALDSFVQQQVLDVYDHANLNRLPTYQQLVPTTENVCIEIWRLLQTYPEARLVMVRVEETGNNSFEYFGGGPEQQ